MLRERIYVASIFTRTTSSILEAFISEDLSLHEPASTEAGKALCEAPAEYIYEATDHHVTLSIWAEPRDIPNNGDGLISKATDFVRDKMPDRVTDPVKDAMLGKFQIIAGATKPEQKAFGVRVASSWLKHHHEKEDDEPPRAEFQNDDPPAEGDELPSRSQDLDRFVYRADAPFDGLDARDIKAIRELKYRAVRAISFRRDSSIYYVVALAKADGVFTEAEDLYLLWLKRVLALDRAIYHSANELVSQVLREDSEKG